MQFGNQFLKTIRWLKTIQNRRFSSPAAIKSFDSIPGPRSLPILGHSHLFGPLGPYSVERLIDCHADLYHQFGPIVRLNLGQPMVLLFDPFDIHKLYHNQKDHVKPKRPLFEALRKYRKSNPDKYNWMGLITENGENWLKMRRITNWLLKPNHSTKYAKTFGELADEFVQYIADEKDDHGYLTDVVQHLTYYTQESIGVVCFGIRFHCFNEKDKVEDADKLKTAIFDTLDAMGKTMLELPLWKYMKTQTYRKLEKSQDYIYEFIEKQLKAAEKHLQDNPSDSETLIFIHYLLQTHKCEDRRDLHLAVNEIFQSGIDATAAAIGWMLYHLARNPETQDRLYKEIQKAVATVGENINVDAVHYFYFCFRETLRLTPTAAGTARILSNDVEMQGYNIPAETLFIGCHPVISLMPEYFPEPNSFKPERWENSRSIAPYASVPVGAGMRTCPGVRIAEQEILMLLVKLLQRFQVEYDGPEVGLVMRLNLVQDKPINLRFIERH